MNLCGKCWDRGRSLAVGCCLCTGDVMTPTAFHKWNASRRVDHMAPKAEVEPKPVIATKVRLEFGKRPEAVKKKTARKGR